MPDTMSCSSPSAFAAAAAIRTSANATEKTCARSTTTSPARVSRWPFGATCCSKACAAWDSRKAEGFEAQLEEMGFEEIYGNFTPGMENFAGRIRRNSILGGAPSAWFATNEVGFGKDLLSDLLSCAHGLWRGDAIDGRALSALVQQ